MSKATEKKLIAWAESQAAELDALRAELAALKLERDAMAKVTQAAEDFRDHRGHVKTEVKFQDMCDAMDDYRAWREGKA